ncbi:single-strand binding protein [Desulfobotulus alkaliphilus]|uniref:Single-stranded DNA-binding protein n=1 Tax=Desulfobotulus alkaliphilus TaxID=622671 RepID=A0A562S671_9BACT|nr:single-stranded DNA-binding protein [Desulfobotulus alkaliphilus]TWI76859.1 single-strand binding protein [Desulfobotulus alkaliphilus]
MSGVNKVILIGNLGADPAIRYFQDGTAVCNFNMATTENWTDRQSGEKRDKTEWHRIVAFRRLAEICGQYLRKGSKVYVEGKLQTRSYEKDGQTRYITEIVASEMRMLDSARSGQGQPPGGEYAGSSSAGSYGGGQGGYGGPSQAAAAYASPSQPGNAYENGGNFSAGPPDDDIPF